MRRRKEVASVTASQLAQMGICERLVVFEHRHGKRPSAQQRAALERGLRAHADFARSAGGRGGRAGRCFIATHVFGDVAPETVVLRAFRDRVLRPSAVGRSVIVHYYRVAPAICRLFDRWPLARIPARVVLRAVARMVEIFLKCLDSWHAG